MLKDYFQENKETLFEELDKSKYPNTGSVLLNFYKKSDSIDRVINSIDFNADYYPCLILVRCQIEHFIVAAYIWIQFRINENDEIARVYNEEYLLYEVLKRINYSKRNNINMSSRIAVAFQKIFDILNEKEVLKQQDFEEINKKANQFDIKRISKFFDENLPLEFDNIITAERIKQFLENYNYLSSFVHGGPSTNALIDEKTKKTFIRQSADFQEWSSNIIGFLRIFIVYFLGMDNEKIKADLVKELENI